MDKRTLVTVGVVLLVGLHGVAGTALADPNATVSRAAIADNGGPVTETLTYEFTADANETATVNGASVPVVETFAGVDRGERLLTVGSHGYVECDVNHGRADEKFGLAAGDSVRLSLSSTPEGR